MKVAQIYDIVNTITKEVLGETAVVNEDLSNIVDVGTQVFDANATDAYVRKLMNQVGKIVFVNRAYSGVVPSVLMDGWEYGSVVEKVRGELPEATENESWELTNGTSYDPNVFYQPTVTVKFYNSKTTFEVPVSITEKQVKQSFQNAEQLNSFISMIYNEVDKSMTIKIDELVMRTIDNFIAETVHAEYGSDGISTKSTTKAVNLLKLYNDKFNTELTADKALTTPEFIRFASLIMGTYKNRLARISRLFNIEKKARFTPADKLHVILLNDFVMASDTYLQSDTYHNEFVKLPEASVVPYWQASGQNYDFADISKIDVKDSNGDTVQVTGILGVMFDHEALGVCNIDRRVTTNYNPKAEFFSNWYKFDAGYFNAFDENFIVFFVA